MIVRIFDISDGKVVPSEHCYAVGALKSVMDKFPDNFLQVYQYVFYMTCPNPELNPFANIAEDDKESMVIREIGINFSLDDSTITTALEFCSQVYDTPTSRAYRAIKIMLDNLSTYMSETKFTHGRDGSIGGLIRAGKDFDDIRKSYKGIYSDFMDEQKSRVRGGSELAYDQK